jgi:hypothetical protein
MSGKLAKMVISKFYKSSLSLILYREGLDRFQLEIFSCKHASLGIVSIKSGSEHQEGLQ